MHVMEKVKSKIKDCARSNESIDCHMRLIQVPPTWTNKQDASVFLQCILLTIGRIGIGYRTPHSLREKGTGPYFYLPKLESHLEARLWNDVFIAAQQYLGVPIGTIRATVLLETITASYEMEEILYELREHSLGLNCGRWDYLFSYIKKFKNHGDKIAPDRSHLTMTTPLMNGKSYRTKPFRSIFISHMKDSFHVSVFQKGNLHMSQERYLCYGRNECSNSSEERCA